MTEGKIYKHKNGKDAVITVLKYYEADGCYLIKVWWHTLSYLGEVMPPVTHFGLPVVYEHVLMPEQLEDWTEYDQG